MPLGKRAGSGTRLPWALRCGSAQQSSMFTYWYPTAFRPLLTNRSAMLLIIASLNVFVHFVEFQLLNPIGGVLANPLSKATAGAVVSVRVPATVARAASAATAFTAASRG